MEEKGKQLPRPSGYRILCAIPEVEETIEGSSLIKSSEMMRNEETLTTVLFVVDMGPDCYKDEKRFPTGPWCKPGDFILIRPHAGSRLVIHGREFRIINDDTVEGVVDDPRGIRRK
jgi:co-chaperonin GroES (HSP10)